VNCTHGQDGEFGMTIEETFGNRLVAYSYAYQRRFIRPLTHDGGPQPGDHLVVSWRGFAHHGIYVGGGRVIHYNARVYRFVRRPVEETDLREFAEGRPVFVVRHDEAVPDAGEVIRLARSRLGEDRYHLFSNNCEHLVEWCLHGVARSFQVESALDFPRRAGEWWRAKLLGWFRKAARAQPVSRTTASSAPVSLRRRTNAANSIADSGGLKWKPWY
jgi:hypothetical protein